MVKLRYPLQRTPSTPYLYESHLLNMTGNERIFLFSFVSRFSPSIQRKALVRWQAFVCPSVFDVSVFISLSLSKVLVVKLYIHVNWHRPYIIVRYRSLPVPIPVAVTMIDIRNTISFHKRQIMVHWSMRPLN